MNASKIFTPKKVPSNINFGCIGSPMQTSCLHCNTETNQMENYNKYLYMKKNWKHLGLKREKYEHKKGYHVYFPKTKINKSIPKINTNMPWDEIADILSGEWRKNPKYSKHLGYGELFKCGGPDPVVLRIRNEEKSLTKLLAKYQY